MLRAVKGNYEPPEKLLGGRVEWEPDPMHPTTLRFHSDDECADCGSTNHPEVLRGRLYRDGKRELLLMIRCPDCPTDTLLDVHGNAWTMGPDEEEGTL